MLAIFSLQSVLTILLLVICTCAYIRAHSASLLDRYRQDSFLGLFWKAARIGERLSPYVAVCCVAMSISVLFFT